MNVFLYIAFLLLGVIFFQDLRSRAIWWFLPSVLFVCFIALKWPVVAIVPILLNSAFVIGLIGFLVIYVRLRFGKLENPFSNYFGLGDFLFLLALTPLVPFREFVYLFTVGTISVLIVHLVVSLFRKSATIPYAGYFALFTGMYLAASAFFPALLHPLTEQYG